MDIKYFNTSTINNINELKKQYKKLAFEFHPDIAKNDGSIMKVINNEYAFLITHLETFTSQKAYEASTNKTNYKKSYYQYDPEFINMINELIKLKMKNVNIEICGFFIYITGTTKPYSKQLGKNGLKLKWNNKKLAWYYSPSWYVKHGSNWDMDKIRSTYGSDIINNENKQDQEKLKIAQ